MTNDLRQQTKRTQEYSFFLNFFYFELSGLNKRSAIIVLPGKPLHWDEISADNLLCMHRLFLGGT